MGIQDLQAFLESTALEGGAVSVDLLKIARNVTQRQQPQHAARKIRPIGNKLKLIVDAENCLDRLYGGYFSDWACGGQWNRMLQFLTLLMHSIERGNIELAVVLNGTIEKSRMSEWIQEQASVRQKVGMVLKHINTKATPPPKIWWTPPTCLRTALRMALRHLDITVMCTMDDHHQEVIAYCREYGFHGLLADDAEYAAFDPPRYFSSEHIKLTYKGSLETKEYMLSELTKTLLLSQEQVCVVASLLGNFLLPESELQDLYKKISILIGSKEIKLTGDVAVKAIAEYVRTLPPPSNMDALVGQIFGNSNEKRASLFRQSVQYYLNGTANGFLKYCPPQGKPEENDFDTSGFASETTEQEQESLQNYKLATANVIIASDFASLNDDSSAKTSPHNDESPPSSDTSRFNGHSSSSCVSNNSVTISTNLPSGSGSGSASGTRVNLQVSSSSSNASSVPQSPNRQNVSQPTCINVITPTVSVDVLRTASLRHQKGLMAPWILHVLSTKEVRLPCVMEDENNREFPPIHEIYQLLRQRVYAVLFNLHHHRYVHKAGELPENTQPPDIIVKEWVYSRSNPYQHAEEVRAEPLPWAVPTLQRLWFGPSLDDKRCRMRALLSCLNSDSPLILNTAYVPQQMFVLACVLRYIMALERPIMRRNELDVFLCQAYNPDLMNVQYLQELTLNVVTSRGVQLAAIFMQGVEMALLANDACGAPLPWLMCCPWLYFDGKLFHHTLARSAQVKSLLDLCENHIERVVKVERLRKAILEGLDVKFAKPPLPHFAGLMRQGMPPANCLPPMPLPSTRGAAALRQRPIPARGGQLQVAGVVVGSWGPNYGYQNNIRQQPQLVGYQGRGRGINNQFIPQQFPRGRAGQRKPGPPTFNVNRKNNVSFPRFVGSSVNKEKGFRNKQKQATNTPKGRGMTVKTESGDVLASEVLKEETLASLSINDTIYDDVKNSEHHGQGDGPPVETTSH
ncbi:constitutive coactivator of peroxisome proliferator-activated receptor gamma [Holotrichia oblita]|uniref:Constitutive coactivator of peroxisome proliferator-activated receptor gamma n=1 Tax=Holotrichia oblita TaxID=644536 RepID=A0ACB9T561_HOLOL|nr:constitutive coactivator of peroxisome proliferator-activated receptor gamma [Holotrichia oblita]